MSTESLHPFLTLLGTARLPLARMVTRWLQIHLLHCALVLSVLLSQDLPSVCPVLSCLSGLIPHHPLDSRTLLGFPNFDCLVLPFVIWTHSLVRPTPVCFTWPLTLPTSNFISSSRGPEGRWDAVKWHPRSSWIQTPLLLSLPWLIIMSAWEQVCVQPCGLEPYFPGIVNTCDLRLAVSCLNNKLFPYHLVQPSPHHPDHPDPFPGTPWTFH